VVEGARFGILGVALVVDGNHGPERCPAAEPRTTVGPGPAPRWSYAAGAVKVEPKADIIKRLGRSPDLADATIYSTLLPWPQMN
jgi:hypothetical protein